MMQNFRPNRARKAAQNTLTDPVHVQLHFLTPVDYKATGLQLRQANAALFQADQHLRDLSLKYNGDGLWVHSNATTIGGLRSAAVQLSSQRKKTAVPRTAMATAAVAVSASCNGDNTGAAMLHGDVDLTMFKLQSTELMTPFEMESMLPESVHEQRLKQIWSEHARVYNPIAVDRYAQHLLRQKRLRLGNMQKSTLRYATTAVLTVAIGLAGVAVMSSYLGIVFTSPNQAVAVAKPMFTGAWYIAEGITDFYATGNWRYLTSGILKGSTHASIEIFCLLYTGGNPFLEWGAWLLKAHINTKTGTLQNTIMMAPLLNYKSEEQIEYEEYARELGMIEMNMMQKKGVRHTQFGQFFAKAQPLVESAYRVGSGALLNSTMGYAAGVYIGAHALMPNITMDVTSMTASGFLTAAKTVISLMPTEKIEQKGLSIGWSIVEPLVMGYAITAMMKIVGAFETVAKDFGKAILHEHPWFAKKFKSIQKFNAYLENYAAYRWLVYITQQFIAASMQAAMHRATSSVLNGRHVLSEDNYPLFRSLIVDHVTAKDPAGLMNSLWNFSKYDDVRVGDTLYTSDGQLSTYTAKYSVGTTNLDAGDGFMMPAFTAKEIRTAGDPPPDEDKLLDPMNVAFSGLFIERTLPNGTKTFVKADIQHGIQAAIVNQWGPLKSLPGLISAVLPSSLQDKLGYRTPENVLKVPDWITEAFQRDDFTALVRYAKATEELGKASATLAQLQRTFDMAFETVNHSGAVADATWRSIANLDTSVREFQTRADSDEGREWDRDQYGRVLYYSVFASNPDLTARELDTARELLIENTDSVEVMDIDSVSVRNLLQQIKVSLQSTHKGAARRSEAAESILYESGDMLSKFDSVVTKFLEMIKQRQFLSMKDIDDIGVLNKTITPTSDEMATAAKKLYAEDTYERTIPNLVGRYAGHRNDLVRKHGIQQSDTVGGPLVLNEMLLQTDLKNLTGRVHQMVPEMTADEIENVRQQTLTVMGNLNSGNYGTSKDALAQLQNYVENIIGRRIDKANLIRVRQEAAREAGETYRRVENIHNTSTVLSQSLWVGNRALDGNQKTKIQNLVHEATGILDTSGMSLGIMPDSHAISGAEAMLAEALMLSHNMGETNFSVLDVRKAADAKFAWATLDDGQFMQNTIEQTLGLQLPDHIAKDFDDHMAQLATAAMKLENFDVYKGVNGQPPRLIDSIMQYTTLKSELDEAMASFGDALVALTSNHLPAALEANQGDELFDSASMKLREYLQAVAKRVNYHDNMSAEHRHTLYQLAKEFDLAESMVFAKKPEFQVLYDNLLSRATMIAGKVSAQPDFMAADLRQIHDKLRTSIGDTKNNCTPRQRQMNQLELEKIKLQRSHARSKGADLRNQLTDKITTFATYSEENFQNPEVTQLADRLVANVLLLSKKNFTEMTDADFHLFYQTMEVALYDYYQARAKDYEASASDEQKERFNALGVLFQFGGGGEGHYGQTWDTNGAGMQFGGGGGDDDHQTWTDLQRKYNNKLTNALDVLNHIEAQNIPAQFDNRGRPSDIQYLATSKLLSDYVLNMFTTPVNELLTTTGSIKDSIELSEAGAEPTLESPGIVAPEAQIVPETVTSNPETVAKTPEQTVAKTPKQTVAKTPEQTVAKTPELAPKKPYEPLLNRRHLSNDTKDKLYERIRIQPSLTESDREEMMNFVEQYNNIVDMYEQLGMFETDLVEMEGLVSNMLEPYWIQWLIIPHPAVVKKMTPDEAKQAASEPVSGPAKDALEKYRDRRNLYEQLKDDIIAMEGIIRPDMLQCVVERDDYVLVHNDHYGGDGKTRAYSKTTGLEMEHITKACVRPSVVSEIMRPLLQVMNNQGGTNVLEHVTSLLASWGNSWPVVLASMGETHLITEAAVAAEDVLATPGIDKDPEMAAKYAAASTIKMVASMVASANTDKWFSLYRLSDEGRQYSSDISMGDLFLQNAFRVAFLQDKKTGENITGAAVRDAVGRLSSMANVIDDMRSWHEFVDYMELDKFYQMASIGVAAGKEFGYIKKDFGWQTVADKARPYAPNLDGVLPQMPSKLVDITSDGLIPQFSITSTAAFGPSGEQVNSIKHQLMDEMTKRGFGHLIKSSSGFFNDVAEQYAKIMQYNTTPGMNAILFRESFHLAIALATGARMGFQVGAAAYQVGSVLATDVLYDVGFGTSTSSTTRMYQKQLFDTMSSVKHETYMDSLAFYADYGKENISLAIGPTMWKALDSTWQWLIKPGDEDDFRYGHLPSNFL